MIIDQIGTQIKIGDSVALNLGSLLLTGTVLEIQDKGIVVALAFPIKHDMPCGGMVKTFEQPKIPLTA